MTEYGPDILRRAEKIRSNLQKGIRVTDSFFDEIFSDEMYSWSSIHWTPMSIAMSAIRMFESSPDTNILDVGSGCGKFCIIAALASPGTYTGIEVRPHLFEAAMRKKELLQAERAEFILGNMDSLDWSAFSGFYFYNPFWENIIAGYKSDIRIIDYGIELNKEQFQHYIETVKTKLSLCRPGTRVVTYHGFGSEMPVGYVRRKSERRGNGYLELWIN